MVVPSHASPPPTPDTSPASPAPLTSDDAPVALLDALFHGTHDGIALIDGRGRIRELNARAAAMFGLDRPSAIGRTIVGLIQGAADEGAAPDRSAWWRGLGLDENGGITECRGLRLDGNAFPLELRLTRVARPGEDAAHVATLRDLTDMRAADEAIAMTLAEMEAANRRYEAMLHHAAFAIVLTDTLGRIQTVNRAAARLLGLPATGPDDLAAPVGPAASFDALVAPDAAPMRVSTASWLSRLEREDAIEHELVLQRPDGHRVPVLLATTALRAADGTVEALLHIAYDITERRAQEARLRQLAFSDPLTGLGNRALLEREVESAIASARRQGRVLSLLFVDLDRFKPVNDTHGHAVGDVVLREVGRRLQQVLRVGDVACRLGGDEFVVLLPAVRRSDDGRLVAAKLRAAVAEPIHHEGLVLSVSASVGAVCWPDAGEDMETLMRAADRAMYEAKRRRG